MLDDLLGFLAEIFWPSPPKFLVAGLKNRSWLNALVWVLWQVFLISILVVIVFIVAQFF